MQYFVDRVTRDFVEGWAVARGGIDRVEVFVDGVRVGDTKCERPRPDVANANPEFLQSSDRCGFLFPFSARSFAKEIGTVKVRIVSREGEPVDIVEVAVPNITSATFQAARRQSEMLPYLAPFPPAVMTALSALRGASHFSHPWTDDHIDEAMGDIELLVRRGSSRIPGIYPYLRYLKGLWAKFVVARDHFPKIARPDSIAKDALAVATTIEEIITISHHLYLLRCHGITGTFTEFGCFKGFSTSLLSSACFELGIKMDVFDSFAGLPISESTYYTEGEFSGSLDEVTSNVTEFGRIDCVTFHKGFFADTLPSSPVSPMCIWMDVDLESSSRDVMTLVGRLPASSCVFSHECGADDFDGNGISRVRWWGNSRDITPSGSDNVIPPIADAFARSGRDVTGRFLFGCTGAFWDRDQSWPVLPTHHVLRLINLQ